MDTPGRRPNSRSVEWSRLTPRSMEIVRQVGIRMTAGYNYEEIAIMLEHNRTDLHHIELPTGPITKAWVSARFRELRREIKELS